MRNPMRPCLLALAILICIRVPASAFGALGHQVIASLAQDMLTPKAKAEVAAILAAAGDGGPAPDLAQVAVWADEVRSLRPETRPWHFVTLQVGDSGYDPVRTDTPNVVTALEKELAILRKPEAGPGDRYRREEALKWVVHLVGDLHQPLHVGEDHDKGGNLDKVKINRRTYNLHAVWDFVLLDRLHLGLDSLHAMLARDIAADPAFLTRNAQGTIRSWVDETHAKSGSCYLLHGKPMRKGIKVGLDRDYVRASTLSALTQLKIAGIRLAYTLNSALDPGGPRTPSPPGRGPPGRLNRPEAYLVHSDSVTVAAEAPAREPAKRGRAAGRMPTARYAWSVNSKVYHFSECADVARINRKNLRWGDFPPPGLSLHAGCPRPR